MFPTATIVFREFIEVALVLGIVMVATQGLPGRVKLILAGLGIGVLGSVIIAFFTDRISQAIDGMGQEIFNATIMFVAVVFISWTVIWMKRHGRDMARNLKEVGDDVKKGNRSIYVLVGVIALATFREGAEIVLFTYGMLASGAFAISEIIIGGLIGAAGGSIIGFMLYLGMLRAFQKYLFSVTSWMLILLSAGMAAQGARFLIAAGVLPELRTEMWDTSSILSAGSFFGEMMGVLVGYTPRPTGMELLFYVGVVIIVGGAYKLIGSYSSNDKAAPNKMPA